MTPGKSTPASQSEPQKTSMEDLWVNLCKMKIREDGEGPSNQNSPLLLDHKQSDKESESSSMDTGRDRKRNRNRKAREDEEGPSNQKKRISPHLLAHKQSDKESASSSVETGRDRKRNRKAEKMERNDQIRRRRYPSLRFAHKQSDKKSASSSVNTGRGRKRNRKAEKMERNYQIRTRRYPPLLLAHKQSDKVSASYSVDTGSERKWNRTADKMERNRQIRRRERRDSRLLYHRQSDTARDGNRRTTQQRAASAKDGRTKGPKRKLSPDKMTPEKRRRVSASELQNTSETDLRGKLSKRKFREHEERPSNKKRRIVPLDHEQSDKESASSSVDTRREGNRRTTQQSVASAKDRRTKGPKRRASPDMTTPGKSRRVSDSEPLYTSVEDITVKLSKMKISEDGDGEEPSIQKMNISPPLLDHKQCDKESASSSVDTRREGNRRTTKRSAASAKDGRDKGTKRKANPDMMSSRKRRRVSASEPQNTSVEDVRVKLSKLKLTEDEVELLAERLAALHL